MEAIVGYNTVAGNSGVYAWYTSNNQLVSFTEGRSYLQMWHPNRMESRAVAAFGGKFMYRLLPRGGQVDIATGSIAELDDDASSVLPTLSVNSPVTVEHVGLPGFNFTFNIQHEFASAGYALKSFAYSVKLGGNRVGSLINQRNLFNLPKGYSAFGDANLTFSSSAGTQLFAAREGPNWPLYQNYTKTGRFSAASGVETKSFLSDVTTFKNNWTLPLDVESTSRAESEDFGQLQVYVPDFQLNSGVATALAYDWSVQTSPFVDLTVTVEEVGTYPMLSELSNLRLRNWDTDADAGHSVLSPTQQDAFAIFRVRLDSTMWWRMRVQFNDVKDMNAPAGVAASETAPSCQPLWELQVVNDFNSGNTGFTRLNEATRWGRRENGYGEAWNSARGSSTAPEGYDWDADFSGSSLIGNGQAYVLNNAWASSGGSFQGSGQEVGSMPANRASWYLVRVSAAPRVLPTTNTFAEQCGSNNIQIGSASLLVDNVAAECASSADCMVDGDDHPAKDRADSDDSANGDATRFSQCVVMTALTADGRRFPSTKCTECTQHAHCESGQYCHRDDGICSLGTNSPDGRFSKWYSCDGDSAALAGICRDKSSDVLGKKCRVNTGFSQTSSANVMHPALQSISNTVSGGSAAIVSSSGNTVTSTNVMGPRRTNPANDAFGEGSNGICGEFRYYNATGVATQTSSSLQGTIQNPFFSQAGTPRQELWRGVCDEDRICRECLPGAGSQGSGAVDGRICLNGQMFSAKDVDGTNRSYNDNTQAGTQLGTTFMVILLILLFVFYMYAQAKEYRHANGLKPLSCCETILCCGACSKLSGAGAGDSKAAPATNGDNKVAPA